MKYVVDTNIFNKLLDGIVTAEELPPCGTYVAMHVQRDELKRTKNPIRRSALLEKFSETIDELVPTDTAVLGESRLDQARLGPGIKYSTIKSQLDALNKGKENNARDALIAEVASRAGYVLLTSDYDLHHVCQILGIGVYYWGTGKIPASQKATQAT